MRINDANGNLKPRYLETKREREREGGRERKRETERDLERKQKSPFTSNLQKVSVSFVLKNNGKESTLNITLDCSTDPI